MNGTSDQNHRLPAVDKSIAAEALPIAVTHFPLPTFVPAPVTYRPPRAAIAYLPLTALNALKATDALAVAEGAVSRSIASRVLEILTTARIERIAIAPMSAYDRWVERPVALVLDSKIQDWLRMRAAHAEESHYIGHVVATVLGVEILTRPPLAPKPLPQPDPADDYHVEVSDEGAVTILKKVRARRKAHGPNNPCEHRCRWCLRASVNPDEIIPTREVLRAERERLGLSQRDLAPFAGISRSQLAAVELGERSHVGSRKAVWLGLLRVMAERDTKRKVLREQARMAR